MLPFIPILPWQVVYLEHLYPKDFPPLPDGIAKCGVMVLGDLRRLIYETDWDSPEALAFEKVWRAEK